MSEIHVEGYSPTIKKRALSRKLVVARKEVGMTTTEVCKRLRWSPTKLNYIEKAKWITPNSEAVKDLCDLYGIEGEDREALVRLAREARERGWWTRYNDVFRNEYPGFEASASIVRSFQNTYVPGLLQHEGYIELVTNAAGIEDPVEVRRHVAARLQRQEILTRTEDPCHLHAVVDENVLRRLVSPSVRIPQVRHLIKMSDLPNVKIQVIPTSTGLYPGAGESFTQLGYSDPGERDIVFLETRIDDRLLEEKDELQSYMVRFERLCAAALDVATTRAYLLDLSKDDE
ncbi:Helix-turn-helix domain-containing protein [Actinomadura meyerae]|uniref:Helix-turn-helix domain-containing protein n=1 Tax=Actinomadura meyerae TaxID=240840 RepID=A0A239KJG0_9ACTN|nr:helix-turn-helix transcriptional regulator [Actinomadura meyerae]SNT18291.1 Helix-turn-helix domain-containing protein [Actinomadura meyerae]